jgi:hypothetical protein
MIKAFLEARAALPLPCKTKSWLLIVSIGDEKGDFTNLHIDAEGPTHYFVFKKKLTSLKADTYYWLSLNPALQEMIENSNKLAQMALRQCLS